MQRLFYSFLSSTFSSWILSFLIPLIMQDLTQSALYTAIAYGISMVPYIIVMPIGGVLGDHYNKQRLLQIIELLNTLLVLLFSLLPLQKEYIGIMLLLHFLLSALHTTHHTLFQAFAPKAVEESQMKKFTALTSLANNLGSIFAPILAGMCCSMGYKPTLLYLATAGYACSFLLITAIRPHITHDKHLTGSIAILQELREGWAYVQQKPFFKYTVYLFFFINLGETFINANLLHYFKSYYISSDMQIGYYYMPMGLGILVGSFLAPYIIARITPGKIIVVGTCFITLCLAFMLFAQGPWMFTCLWGLNKVGTAIISITFESIRQVSVPNQLLSRVIAITRMVAYLAIPIASFGSGWIFEQTHSFNYLLIGSLLSIALGIMRFGKPLYQAPALKKQ